MTSSNKKSLSYFYTLCNRGKEMESGKTNTNALEIVP
jgi:hypothetical protein